MGPPMLTSCARLEYRGHMAAPRKLPEKDRLRTLLLSGRSVLDIAATYDCTVAAVRRMIAREGLEATVTPIRPSFKTFIPWRVAVHHSNDYPVRMLRLYVRSLGLGTPLDRPDLEDRARHGALTVEEGLTLSALRKLSGQLALFEAEMDKEEVVIDYEHDTGFQYVDRKPGDKHYVRWPAGVSDKRDDVLARLRANST